jgi:hypothetical protein
MKLLTASSSFIRLYRRMRIEDQVGDQKFRWQIYLRHIVALVRVPERSLGLRVDVLKVSTSNNLSTAHRVARVRELRTPHRSWAEQSVHFCSLHRRRGSGESQDGGWLARLRPSVNEIAKTALCPKRERQDDERERDEARRAR